ncbi:MAG TPA: tetratricopeptide repeat protein [Pyrinomonadaceae bacterium]|nr:tetratricopeptide repeat protein [Pyrinomonadaceae bacterium]
MNSPKQQTYRLADIEFDTLRGRLRRNGEESYLREQSLQVFCYLIEHRAETVTKEALIDNVWQGTAVTDDALVQCIVEIRKALGDDSRHPQFIKTVPKTGYRFIAPVEELGLRERTTVETEEVTSVQVEEEEEITFDEAATKSRFLSRAATLSRVAFTTALILVLVTALGLYFYQKSTNSRREFTNLSLPGFAGKTPVAIMFFEDRSGGAELDWLREGLPDMLISELSRSPKLAVLSRQQLHLLLERIGHKAGDAISFNQALDIAQKTQAQVVITGSFTRIEDKIRVEVQLHNAAGGQLLVSEHFVVDKPNHILMQMDLLSLKLRKQMGVMPAEQDGKVGLTDVMTKNLEAYRYYSQALEKAQGLHNTEAIALLEKAIALDPEFAMAHARIGYAYAVTWNFADKARPHLERAFKLSERLTEKDKLHISAWYAIANLDYEGAIGEFRRIIAGYPLEIEAYLRLGLLLMGEELLAEALEVAKQGLIIDPEAKELYNLLGGIYLYLGRNEEAIASYQRYIALAPGEPNAFDSLGLGYQWAGRYQEAIEAYHQALELKPDFEVAVIHLGNVYFQQGRYQDAVQQYQRYIQIVPTAFERSRGFNNVAYVYWRKGNLAKAETAARRELESEKTTIGSSFLLAVDRGRLALAERLISRLTQGPYTYRGTRPPPRERRYLEGYLNLKRGQTIEALQSFKEALTHRPLVWSVESYEDCLGRAYLELGQLDQAIAEFERILSLNPNYPLAHYHLAQAYERKGQAEKARELFERFLQVWKDADADVPEIVTARNRLTGR